MNAHHISFVPQSHGLWSELHSDSKWSKYVVRQAEGGPLLNN